MFWTFLLFLLVCAIVGVLWWRHRQEKEWMMELTYMSRHEGELEYEPKASFKEAKEVRAAEPNLQNTRQSHKAAEEAKAVYDKTVEKLRVLYPKHSKKLDATSGKSTKSHEEDGLNELPIFAAAPKEETFDEIGELTDEPAIRNLKAEPLSEAKEMSPKKEDGSDIPMFGAMVEPQAASRISSTPRKAIVSAAYIADDEADYQPAKVVDSSLPIITLEEATRAMMDSSLSEIAEPEPLEEGVPLVKTLSAPNPDMEVVELNNWQFKPALESTAPPKPVKELKTIDLNDPAVARTRERVLLEVQKLTGDKPLRSEQKSVMEAFTNMPPETIGEEDIRANLLRQRMARRRQVVAQEPVQSVKPNVIPDDEVFANLAGTDSPVSRRPIRRINTVTRASVIPESARVEQSHGVKLQPTRVSPSLSSIAPTRASYAAVNSATAAATSAVVAAPIAEIPAPNATVVEPPIMPQVEAPVMNIPAPPAFNASRENTPNIPPSVQANVHVSDAPRWSISDRLISEGQLADMPSEKESPFDDSEWDADAATVAAFEHTSHPELAQAAPTVSIVPAQLSSVIPAAAQQMAQAQVAKAEKHLPSVDLLLPPQFDPAATPTEEALLENSITIEEKLAEFKVKVKVMDAYSGPVITRYEIEPDVGVRGNAVLNLEKDLARSLGVASIRVVETIPGKTCMGLELPNPRRQMIRLSEIFNSPAFQESKSKLTLALGQDITGEAVVTDLGKAPHLLVAGTTGSGKSVGVNAMILSMLYKATPEDVRMIMIDPKMLELSIYEGIPHLLAPVVTDMKLAANALNWCVNEMEKRYRLMSHVGVRNLAGFNQKIAEAAVHDEKIANPFSLTPDDPEPLEKLPFIVVVVDEFADLMMTAGKKIEELIARLAQKARAAGIHLILATQRPSVDVITGLIKANIPTRIAFQVSSKVDSRTILDQMGAENLLGQGDMLFLPPGTSYPKRVHGAFTSDDEVHTVVEYLKQFGEPAYVDDILTSGVGSDDIFSNANSGRNNDGEQDPLYDEAVACVIKTKKATISSVQRHLRIGYNRAARLIDQMEADGIVSAPETNGNRTIYAQGSDHLD